MAKKVVKKAGKAKIKKKWVPIVAPKSFNSQTLGETHVDNPETAVGKSITANLMNLTGDMRKQGIEVRFDALTVTDGKIQTAVTGYELLPANLKRLIRRGRSKVADSFITRTATKRRVRVKPLLITTNRTSARTCTAIRLAVREKVKQLLSGMSFEKFVQELIGFKVQRAIKDAASAVHPIKTAEIRVCQLLPEGTSEKREVRADYRDEDFVEVKEEQPKEHAKEAEQKAAEPEEQPKPKQKTAEEQQEPEEQPKPKQKTAEEQQEPEKLTQEKGEVASKKAEKTAEKEASPEEAKNSS